MSIVDTKLKRYTELKNKKQLWHNLWQKVGEYVHTKKQDFTTANQEGSFLNEELYDSTAPKANRKMAASLIGNLWPNGGRSVKIVPVRGLKESKEIKNYFEEINEVLFEALDDPSAGLVLALEEYMNDQGSFGASGLYCDDSHNDESELIFRAWGVDEVCLEEGKNGTIDIIYREFEWTVNQIVTEYGEENVSKKILEKWNDGQYDDKFKILHIIEPREMTPNRKGNEAMPYMSLHFEIESRKILRESGFQEKPAYFARFFKKRGETYGRSPAMDALPDILELNATKEARINAIEKSLDPPLAIENDGILGNGSIDTSAGAINVLNITGRAQSTGNPIFPLYTVETIREADKSIEELKTSINEHFNIDRLLDFNNNTQMTLGETQMRAAIRAQALGSLFTRQINEVLTPIIERAVAVLFRKERLGLFSDDPLIEEAELLGLEEMIKIPDEVAKLITAGKNFYTVKYDTPAARMMQAEEAQGIIRTWEFAGQLAQLDPEVMDNLDADKSLSVVASASGAPSSVMVSKELVAKIREQRAQQMQAQQQAQQAQQQLGQAEQAANIAQTMEPQANENEQQ